MPVLGVFVKILYQCDPLISLVSRNVITSKLYYIKISKQINSEEVPHGTKGTGPKARRTLDSS